MKKKKGPPLQIILIFAFVLALISIMGIKLANPAFKAEAKAKATAQFFLEASGFADMTRQGKEMHPQPRRKLNPEAFAKYMQSMDLDQAIKIKSWHEEKNSLEPREWRWRVKLEQNNSEFSVYAFVRLPEEMTLSRRWRMYSLCRPELDLQEAAIQIFQGQFPGQNFIENKALNKEIQKFAKKPLKIDQKGKITSYTPLSWSIQSEMHKVQWDWRISAGEAFQCRYEFIGSR